MGKLEIVFSRAAAKDYKKLPADYKTLVDKVLMKLSEGLPLDLKPIEGESASYRIRVGKYRLLFSVDGQTAIISKIGSRGDVYK
ncbi:MAG: type II toxin-antitoxin system RelE/ParE family toxin [Nitrospiraceae bacterium]|nr:type II toxin-antitoxin system RelE/ParE family toxin [Nitrospiraceae bacterium]